MNYYEIDFSDFLMNPWGYVDTSWTGFIGRPEHKWDVKDDVLTLSVIIPGAKKEGIRVYVSDDLLHVSYVGGKDSSVRDFDNKWHLPDIWEVDTMESRYENGILFVSVNRQKCKETEIKVK